MGTTKWPNFQRDYEMDIKQENSSNQTFAFNDITEKIIGCAFTVMNTLEAVFWKKFMRTLWLWSCGIAA